MSCADRSLRADQRGVIAVLTALLVLALAATLATAMIWNRGLGIVRTATLTQGDQAYAYALGAEAWAGEILRRDWQQNNGAATNLSQNWALQLPPLPVDGGQINGKLEDLQGRFNLNNIVTANGTVQAPALQQFQRLLTALNIDPNVANAVADWMTPSTVPTNPGGAKDDFYTRLMPPYLTAARPMTSASELQLINGITPQVYARLSPYVTTLPTQTPVNVNTASAAVLQSLDPNGGINGDEVVQRRGTQGFAAVTGANGAFPTINVAPGAADVKSNYFLLTAGVDIGTTHVTLYSLLYRGGTGGVITLRRSLGIY